MSEVDIWSLASRGEATALIDAPSGSVLTYRQLWQRCRELAEQLVLPDGARALVFVSCGPDVGTIVAYLGAVAAGHVVFLMDGKAHAAQRDALRERYRPDFVLQPRGAAVDVERRAVSAPRPLSDALTLLLSTSGTTGSPKLVRLSRENLRENARSIAEYLGLGPDERAIASLPFHYSYGLSVLNSHLHAGGSLVLTDASIMRPEFWQAFDAHGCTSFAGVPYSYQILRRTGFEKLELKTLRTLTQAGGKLPAKLVTHFHAHMAARGGRFFTMYGQTEATARMSYLPPEAVGEHAGSIGRAIPGGSLHVMDGERELEEVGQTGELVYRGPNVMLGYATQAEDLALGDVQRGELRTGDLGHRDAHGYFHVTGRLKRFAKVYGLRVNLDEIEAIVREHGAAALVSDDEKLVAFCEFDAPDVWAALKTQLAERLQLNANTFRFEHIEALPLLPTGKVDYDALRKRLR